MIFNAEFYYPKGYEVNLIQVGFKRIENDTYSHYNLGKALKAEQSLRRALQVYQRAPALENGATGVKK